METFIADQLERWRPKTAQIRYGALMQFFKWCVEEGEISATPMRNMKPPSLPEVPVPVVSDDDLKVLLKTCDEARPSSNERHRHLAAVHRVRAAPVRGGRPER